MINVLFFAQVRELTNTASLTVAAEYATVEALRCALAAKVNAGRWHWSRAGC